MCRKIVKTRVSTEVEDRHCSCCGATVENVPATLPSGIPVRCLHCCQDGGCRRWPLAFELIPASEIPLLTRA